MTAFDDTNRLRRAARIMREALARKAMAETTELVSELQESCTQIRQLCDEANRETGRPRAANPGTSPTATLPTSVQSDHDVREAVKTGTP